MVLKVYKYGEAVLREKAVPVALVDDRLRQLADDMIETMHRAKGVGLAAERAYARGEAVSAQELLPVYLRPAQAERLRSSKLNQ